MAIIDRLGRNVDGVSSAASTDPNADLAIKVAVQAATTANITLSGLQTIDGVVLAENDRVLVKNQTTTTQNGIYNASTSSWTRAVDADGNTELANGTLVFVIPGGTVHGGKWFRLSGTDPIVIDSSAIAFVALDFPDSAIEFIIDGGGTTVTTGDKGAIEVPFGCTITAWRILSDQSGSIVVDVRKSTYANLPMDGTDSIAASAKPTLSAAQKNQDTTLTGWMTSVTAGEWIGFNVDSVTGVQRAVVSLRVSRN